MPNVNDFIANLNTIAEKNAVSVFLPSLQKKVKFKPISAIQHKNIYACVQDNAIYNTKFIITTYDIIKNNCLEPDVVKQLNIIDRVCILLALRKDTMGSAYKNLDFSACLNSFKSIDLPVSETVDLGEIKIVTQIPVLEESSAMEQELRADKEIKKLTVDEITQEIIINSCCKFIKEILVNEKPLNFKAFSYKDRLTIIENLPASTITLLQGFAEKVTSLQDNITVVTNADGTKTRFFVDVDFFSAE